MLGWLKQSEGGYSASLIHRTVLLILLLLLVGIALSAYTLARQEERQGVRDIQDRGTYLVNLISYYPLKDYDQNKRLLFLKTLTESTTYNGFAYLFIHNDSGQAFISIASPEVSSEIPDTVLGRSISSTTLVSQSYKPERTGYVVYEFAKPVFENGKKSGVVRLGLRLYPVQVLSMKRISLLAMIAFFSILALLVGYYGVSAALRSLKAKCAKTFGSDSDRRRGKERTLQSDGFPGVLNELEESFIFAGDKMNEIREDNVRLVSRLGVAGFEKNQLVNVFDSISFGIVVADIQNRVTFANEYMLRLIDAKREDVIDKDLEQVFPQKELGHLFAANNPEDTEAPAKTVEIGFPDRAPGEIFQISSCQLTSRDKTITGKMVLARNVTGVSMTKKTQEEFIAHVAHELMTSLTNIRAYSEMLMDGEVENAEMQKEFYNTINQETRRLTATVHNLLNISKMEAGNLTLNKGLLRTDWFVDDCVSTIEASAKSKQVKIEKRVPDVMPSFIADKELLKTAVINILGNAVKYTPENGKITFSMEEEPSSIVFDVADTGYGISEEDLPHIFEKFYRSGDPHVKDETGTGLGLATAHEIVRLHEGDIEVQSTLGEGSRFTIRIPKEEYAIGAA